MPNQLTDFDPIHLTYLTSLHPTPLTQSRTVGHCLDSILPDCHGPVAILTFPWLPPKNCPKLWNKRGKSLETTKIREREPQNHYQQHFTKKRTKNIKTNIAFSKSDIFNLLFAIFLGVGNYGTALISLPWNTKSDGFSGKLSTLTPLPPAWWLSSWPRKTSKCCKCSLKRTSMTETYCWWTKSCTTKDDDYPIIYRVLTIPGGAGFCPSTVSWVSYMYLPPTLAICQMCANKQVLYKVNSWQMR